MKIVIDKKAFELKFGFKCFMNLGRALGLETFNQVIEKFASLENASDTSFDQLELLEKLVIAAAESHPQYYNLEYSIMDVSVIDHLMANQSQLTEIMQAFADSFPKTEGKQKAPPKKRKTKK